MDIAKLEEAVALKEKIDYIESHILRLGKRFLVPDDYGYSAYLTARLNHIDKAHVEWKILELGEELKQLKARFSEL